MILFPLPPAKYDSNYFARLLQAISSAYSSVVRTDRAVSRIMLQSPNGTVYEVTVDNSGNLTTAVNDGKSRE